MKKAMLGMVATVALGWSAALFAQNDDVVTVSSSAFAHHGMVPEQNSAYGANESIDLSWSDLPEGTVELALIMDDPIVVQIGMMEQPFVHWVAYNIPADAPGLPANLSKDAEVSGVAGLEGMINGLNGLGRPGYFGPRPPANGQLHAYHFRVYALDADLDLAPGLGKDELLAAMDGHILGSGMLMGHYERKE
ncbi:MAG: YbhB/YbcL family Raf kinase inhibitor-like protein [Pseudomonadales bacterium]|nr:YbhB/YbcL family Raf kinase inhibitor-like protein [Pseudomonadales bacterium]